jgi:uncharacterized membrane protein YciS (DUF1049 family)
MLSTGVLVCLNPRPTTLAWWLILLCAYLGLSSLAILGIRAIWAEGTERKLLSTALSAGLLLFAIGWLTIPMMFLGMYLRPKVLDLFLYSFDCSLRIQPSFLMGVLFWKWPWIERVSLFCYLGIAIPVMTVFAAQLVRKTEHGLPVLLAFVACGVFVFPIYNVFPALGPRYVFQTDFPFHPLSIAEAMRLRAEPIALWGFRNAMPSMHLGWVLLAWWYSRGFSWWTRGTAFVFLLFTVTATLGLGEHYLIDLIVAFPFTLLVLALFSFPLPRKHKERVRALWLGTLGMFGWFALLRYATRLFWVSPVIPWALIAATLVTVTVQKDRLSRALERQSNPADPVPVAVAPARA